jgi:tripartite-type tricarboxylate transporter receptor subunit TctC
MVLSMNAPSGPIVRVVAYPLPRVRGMAARACNMRRPLIVSGEPIQSQRCIGAEQPDDAKGPGMSAILRRSAWLAAAMVLAAGTARAADYPNRTVKVVVPFAAAGVTDIVARVVFDNVGRALNQSFVIDNRPGAGGTIAVEQTVKAPADGYTIVMADPSGSLPANVTLYPKLSYDPVRDLAPIAIFGTTGANLLVPAASPARTAQELVAMAKEKPGELTFASTGIGTPGHLNGELFSRLAGIKTVHVPYRVVGQAVTDLVAGRIAFWIAPIPTMLQNVRQEQLRALAVAGDARSVDLPGVPTIKETGIGDFDASTTYAVFAPAGTPKDVIGKLHAEIGKALDDPEVQDKLRKAGVLPKLGAPEEITRMMRQRIPQWADVIKSAGITIN